MTNKELILNDQRIKKLNLEKLKCFDRLFREYDRFKEEILLERNMDGFCYNAVKYDKSLNRIVVCLATSSSPIAKIFYDNISDNYFYRNDKLSFDYRVFDLTNDIDSFIKYLIELSFSGDTHFDGSDELIETLDYKLLFRLLDDEKIETMKNELFPIFGDTALHIAEYLLLHDLSSYDNL